MAQAQTQTQKPSLYDGLIQTIESQNRQLKDLNKSIDSLITIGLQKSALYEGAKKELAELKVENDKKDVVILRLLEVAYTHLEMFEQIFDSDENALPYPKMKEYLEVSEYMERKFNRTSGVGYIRRVKEAMNRLPFPE